MFLILCFLVGDESNKVETAEGKGTAEGWSVCLFMHLPLVSHHTVRDHVKG